MIIASYTIIGNTLFVMGNGYCDMWPLTDVMCDGYLKDKVFEADGKQWSVGSCLMASMKRDSRYGKMFGPIPPGHQGYRYLTGSSSGIKEVHEKYGILFL
jgi:hypothetical protein